MKGLLLKIYDFMLGHRRVCLLTFLGLTALLGALLLRLDFKEDISDFLPLDNRQQESLSVYQDVAGASRLIAVFQHTDTVANDPDAIVSAIGDFEETLMRCDTTGLVRNLTTEFDLESISEITDFAYANIPLFLTEADYARMDSLLADPGYISSRLEEDKQMLMFPTGGMLSANLQKDPLNLFSPAVSRLQQEGSPGMEIYDGRLFTPDMKRGMALMESPFGNSETQNNARMMAMLQSVADSVSRANPGIAMHYIGGPAIAVGNADRIRTDSVLSILIASVLIVALLVVVFRSARNLLLIVISVGWGWLFAMALLSVVHSSVSLIVVGISSIILGIAVNYPLHLIAHLDHTPNMRETLREIIAPLVIGNITTVGAFLALVPLKAVALRDLGIFSAFILIGTILFVVVYLPHAARRKQRSEETHSVKWLTWLSNLKPEKSRVLVVVVVVLTGVFAWYSTRTGFDANMSNINYMTGEQKADMEYFSSLISGNERDTRTLYIVTEGTSLDEALEKNRKAYPALAAIASGSEDYRLTSPHGFLPSTALQQERLARWQKFIAAHGESLDARLDATAAKAGFQPEAFDEFHDIVNGKHAVQEAAYFEPLRNIWAGNVSLDEHKGEYRAVNALTVPADKLEKVRAEVQECLGDRGFCFDVQSMNSALANGLSDNFNYIGWACGLIVFFFLWFSFSSVELAALSFLPMAVSWVWIMGIMGMTGIQFNIVNIILATFIFGQGDDYTIFMTEGCCYEYACRRKMLGSYKSSIIVSALIMFIGIGSLIIARHPALHSLAEVTIIGMFSVVLMAWLLPPLVFRWLTMSHGEYRLRPLTLGPVLRTWFCGAWWISQLATAYLLGAVLFGIFGRRKATERIFRRYVSWSHRLDTKIMPGVKFKMSNPYHETLERPAVIVCNHQSLLDPMYFMAWSPKIIIVANERSSLNPVVRIMFKWLRFYTVRASNFTAWKDSSLERDMEKFRELVAQGYSIAFFPEGKRNAESSLLRWHKGPFYLARELGIDILPVLLHGVNYLMPERSFACYSGEINMRVGERITPASPLWSNDYAEMTRSVRGRMAIEYREMCRKLETADYFAPLVLDRYRYKGTDVWQEVRNTLKRNGNYAKEIDKPQPDVVTVNEAGYGEYALLLALVHPEIKVIVCEEDEFKREVARYAALGVVTNMEFRAQTENIYLKNSDEYEEDSRIGSSPSAMPPECYEC